MCAMFEAAEGSANTPAVKDAVGNLTRSLAERFTHSKVEHFFQFQDNPLLRPMAGAFISADWSSVLVKITLDSRDEDPATIDTTNAGKGMQALQESVALAIHKMSVPTGVSVAVTGRELMWREIGGAVFKNRKTR